MKLKRTISLILISALSSLAVLSYALPCVTRADSASDLKDAGDAAAIVADAIACGAHRCNIDMPSAGNVFLEITGSFDNTAKDDILNLVNSYRLEACRLGLPDPRSPGRRLTSSDYVPVRWSYDLEQMSMLRAAEACYTHCHLTLLGSDFTRSSYSVLSTGEALSWTQSISNALETWHSEKIYWGSGNASSSGNYSKLIDPSNTYFAASGFNGAVAGEFSNAAGLDETKTDVSSFRSQLAQINFNYVSGITVNSNAGYCLVGMPLKLYASASITVQGYDRNYSYSGVKLLPVTWWSGSPSFLTVDRLGYATGVTPGMANACCKFNGSSYASSIRIQDGNPVKDFVNRLYTVALERGADAQGLAYWTNRLISGNTTGSQAAAGFIFSSEFISGNLTNEEYIRRLYRTFFNREPDDPGFSYWMDRLRQGASREDIFTGFTGSSEFSRLCAYAGILP